MIKESPVFTQAVLDVLRGAGETLGLRGTYYGVQDAIPDFPAVVVSSGNKIRELNKTHKFDLRLHVTIMVHHEAIQNQSITKKQAEELAEAIEDTLAVDRRFGGLVIFSWVSSIDPGVTNLGGVMMRSTRLILEAMTQETF